MSQWEEFQKINPVAPSLVRASFEVTKYMPAERAAIGDAWLRNPRKSLLLIGPTGRGKTYFMHALMRGLLQKYRLGALRFMKSKQMDDRMYSDFNQYGTASYFIEQLKEVPFLFIDDLGNERSGERTERDYYEVIDHRIEWEKPMVISTNAEDKDILNKFGARIHSRLKIASRVPFVGPDIRESL